MRQLRESLKTPMPVEHPTLVRPNIGPLHKVCRHVQSSRELRIRPVRIREGFPLDPIHHRLGDIRGGYSPTHIVRFTRRASFRCAAPDIPIHHMTVSHTAHSLVAIRHATPPRPSTTERLGCSTPELSTGPVGCVGRVPPLSKSNDWSGRSGRDGTGRRDRCVTWTP